MATGQESRLCHKCCTAKGLQPWSGEVKERSFSGNFFESKLMITCIFQVNERELRISVPNPFGQGSFATIISSVL